MDATIEKLEQLQEKLPVKDVFGSFNPEYVEVNGAIEKLKQASKNIHDVMELAFDKDVKSFYRIAPQDYEKWGIRLLDKSIEFKNNVRDENF